MGTMAWEGVHGADGSDLKCRRAAAQPASPAAEPGAEVAAQQSAARPRPRACCVWGRGTPGLVVRARPQSPTLTTLQQGVGECGFIRRRGGGTYWGRRPGWPTLRQPFAQARGTGPTHPVRRSSRMLCGFRSRCMMLRACANASALSTWNIALCMGGQGGQGAHWFEDVWTGCVAGVSMQAGEQAEVLCKHCTPAGRLLSCQQALPARSSRRPPPPRCPAARLDKRQLARGGRRGIQVRPQVAV